MPNAKLTVGASGSGKSYWAKGFVAENPGWIIVCRDDIRAMQGFPPLGTPDQEKVVTKVQRGLIESAFLDGFNVVIADTNLNNQVRNNLVNFLHKQGADVEFEVFDTPLNVCIERDAGREKPVGEKVIRKQYNRFQSLPELPPAPVQKFDPIPPLSPTKEDVVVFDLDGTLAEHVARSPYDYDRVYTDEVIRPVANFVHILREFDREYGYGRPIFVSGRPDSCRHNTVTWLANKLDLDPDDISLYMRKEGDDRADWIIKSEIYDQFLLPQYNVIAAFDDRDQVVRHMRQRGLTVFQVRPGRF